jgi:hypothetical protein
MLYLCGKVTMTSTHQMETPIEYKRNYREGKVSREMLCECIYSLNQRRERYSEKFHLYHHWLQHSTYVTDALKQWTNNSYKKACEYANAATYLIQCLRPCEIHKHRRWNADEQKEREVYYIIYKEGNYVFRRHIPSGFVDKYDLNIIEMTKELRLSELPALTLGFAFAKGVENTVKKIQGL